VNILRKKLVGKSFSNGTLKKYSVKKMDYFGSLFSFCAAEPTLWIAKVLGVLKNF
jgi:hypothetical protein